MRLNIFAYYNVLGGFFGQPQFVVGDKEQHVEMFKQSLYRADVKTLRSLLEDDLYFLGVFDNESGVIESSKEFVMHCSDIASSILNVKKDEDESDVGKD